MNIQWGCVVMSFACGLLGFAVGSVLRWRVDKKKHNAMALQAARMGRLDARAEVVEGLARTKSVRTKSVR